MIEYTHPYFWKGLFLDLSFSKVDEVAVIEDEENQKLTNNYDIKLTCGANIIGNLSSYFFQKERYEITKTVDKDFEKVPLFLDNKQFLHSSGIMFVYDSLNDTFFISQGLKLLLEYEVFWKTKMAQRLGFSGEIYLPIPIFDLIAAVSNRSNILFTDPSDTETTLSLDSKMRTSVQEITDIDYQQIKLTTYSSIELRFPLSFVKKYTDALSFVLFAEAGAAWREYDLFSMADISYGFGIGFRLSPRKHYSSFLFQFPAGLYLGYRSGTTSPDLTLISHRDSLYYINLTASF